MTAASLPGSWSERGLIDPMAGDCWRDQRVTSRGVSPGFRGVDVADRIGNQRVTGRGSYRCRVHPDVPVTWRGRGCAECVADSQAADLDRRTRAAEVSNHPLALNGYC